MVSQITAVSQSPQVGHVRFHGGGIRVGANQDREPGIFEAKTQAAGAAEQVNRCRGRGFCDPGSNRLDVCNIHMRIAVRRLEIWTPVRSRNWPSCFLPHCRRPDGRRRGPDCRHDLHRDRSDSGSVNCGSRRCRCSSTASRTTCAIGTRRRKASKRSHSY